MNAQRRISEAELHAFVDGELTGDERAEIEALLAESPADLEAARALADLNERLRAHYGPVLAEPLTPPMLRSLARVRARKVWSTTPWRALAAALLIAIVGGAAGYILHSVIPDPAQADRAFVTTALSAHTVYLPEVRHPVEVSAAEEKHLVQWLTKRIGAPVRAPALTGLGWKLVGGRLLPDHGLPAAQFMYEDATGGRLTLYVRKETGLLNTSFRFYERDGFGAFYWIDRPLAYALAGRLKREQLMALANAVYAQLDTIVAKPPEETR